MDNMQGQLDIFEYMQERPKFYSWLWQIAEFIKGYSEYWNNKWLEQLQEDKSVENFTKMVCMKLRVFYFHKKTGEGLWDFEIGAYRVEFDIQECILEVRKCDKTFNKIVYKDDIEELLKYF